MYNDGGVTDNLWTGYYDSIEDEYVYPDAHQNFVIKFDDFYLSADDGDFTTDGVTITSEVCQTEDITIGNAPAKVLTATMLNPDGLMDNLTWGYGSAFVGVVTDEQTINITGHMSQTIVIKGTSYYRFDLNILAAPHSSTTIPSGSGRSILVYDDGTAWFVTDSTYYYYDGNNLVAEANVSTPLNDFMLAKLRQERVGILLDANGAIAKTWVCTATRQEADQTTFAFIPMGVFNFDNIDAHGITFSVEAYDKMLLFDADATEWFNSIDFASPPTKDINWIVSEILFRQFGNSQFYESPDVVNGTMSWDKNPIPTYSVTYRQILKYLCELMGGWFHIHRDGTPDVSTLNPNWSAATITPDTVVVNSRTTARYSTPAVTEVKCYDVFGQPYTVGTPGSTYFIVGNPFIDPANDLTPLNNLCTLLSSEIPGHYPTTLVATCFDPRIDEGDLITIQSTDRLSSHKIHIMHMTLKWNGTCTAAISATGNQVRAVPSSLTASDLASQVNSNPAARTVDWEVETPSSVVPGQNDKESLSISTGQIITSETTWDDLGSGPFTYEKTSLMEHGELELAVDTTNDPDGGKRSTTNIFGGHMSLDNEAGGYPDPGGTYQQVMIDPEYPHAIQVSSGTVDSGGTLVDNSVWIGADDIQLTKGNYTKTITADGPAVTYDTGDTTVPTGTGFTECTHFTLTPGTWLISCQANFDSNATGYRRAVLSSTSASGSSVSRTLQGSNAAVNGTYTMIHFASVLKVSANTTYYLNACQTSGANRTCSWGYTFVRLA